VDFSPQATKWDLLCNDIGALRCMIGALFSHLFCLLRYCSDLLIAPALMPGLLISYSLLLQAMLYFKRNPFLAAEYITMIKRNAKSGETWVSDTLVFITRDKSDLAYYAHHPLTCESCNFSL
jgi:hypothetical protein